MEEFHVAATLLAITAQALTGGVLEAAVSEEYREPVQNGLTEAIGSDVVVANGPFSWVLYLVCLRCGCI